MREVGQCIFHHALHGRCPEAGSPYCPVHAEMARIGWIAEEADAGQPLEVTVTLSPEETLACIDWIREGESRLTVGLVTAVLKRIVGGG